MNRPRDIGLELSLHITKMRFKEGVICRKAFIGLWRELGAEYWMEPGTARDDEMQKKRGR